MKKINSTLATLLVSLAVMTWNSCDKVKFPKQADSSSSSRGPTYVRKVLLEDYTAHTCDNCPHAGQMADSLESIYGSKLIRLTVHAGYLAFPSPPTYPYDFQTTVGTDYLNTFGIGAWPNGLINRQGGPTIYSYGSWPSAVATALSAPPDADLKITTNYNTNTRALNVSVRTKFLNSLAAGYYKLVVLFVEDSIQKPQKYDLSPYILPNYEHRYVLRGSLNGNGTGWGDTLFYNTNIGPYAGDSIIKSCPAFTVPTNYNNPSTETWAVDDHKCYVVAFIYDADPNSPTHYQVIQADHKRIR